ncbi:DUF4097 family beta strand repeat-containing protein [Nocardia sp. NPDC058058]|uniref:DUF4097 family beta strand repeat-containing protein n=1 Tax=Nocardia sp. NPDC058058 TaxID=3346317 RepID=UPI0036DBA79B
MTTFQTPAPIALSVDVPSGSVQIIASDRSDTVVQVRPANPADKDDVRAAKQIKVDFSAGTLTVKTPKSWRTYSPFGGNAAIEVVIEAPTGSRLEATLAMGRLLASGAFDGSDLEVSCGDIIVDSPRGAVTARTAKGDIRVGDAADGVLRLETSMGELEVGVHPGSAVQLETNTQHGSVRNQLAPVAADAGTVQVHARNSYGNIIVHHSAA